MAEQRDSEKKKPRVSREDLTKIKRLYQEGKSIAEIVSVTGFHRHTIRRHLRERAEDIVAESVRREVLTEALKQHFSDLSEYARTGLRARLDSSVPQSEQRKARTEDRSITTDGLLGMPYRGTPEYMAEEWLRMYHPSPKEKHLQKALRDHSKESSIWIGWDRWRETVFAYEKSSWAFRDWLVENVENVSLDNISPLDRDSFVDLAFGNILRIALGEKPAGRDNTVKDTVTGDVIQPPVLSDDISPSPLSKYLVEVLMEAQKRPAWPELVAATEQLSSGERQRDLRRLAGEIDEALVSVELTHAFPGHCELCPA